MAEIKEEYVSFETAKLMKEKGFDQNCATYYLDGQVWRHYHGEVIPKGKKIYAAPTQAMAMKWLREVHNCPIEILWHWDANSQCSEWCFRHHMELKPLPQIQYYDTYEEAYEAAIKYCLTDII